MKKLFTSFILIILCAVFLTACTSSGDATNYLTVWGQSNVCEISRYEISAAPLIVDDKPTNENEYKLDPSSHGEYTIKVTAVLENGNHVGKYKLESEFEFTGKYNKNGNKTEEFTDKYKSEVIFKLTSRAFTTLSSVKTAENMTICNDDGTLDKVSYTVTNTYDNKKVKTVMEIKSDPNNVLKDLADSKSLKLGNGKYFDNEALFFGIRALEPNDKFSWPFVLLDSIQQKVFNWSASYVSQEKNEIELTKDTVINGKTTEKIDCNLISAAITGTVNKGAPIDLYYSKDYPVVYKAVNGVPINIQYHILAKIEHGDMIYTLKEFTNTSDKV